MVRGSWTLVEKDELPCFRADVADFTQEEGGLWIPAAKWKGELIQAVRLKNGRIWDCFAGWRDDNWVG